MFTFYNKEEKKYTYLIIYVKYKILMSYDEINLNAKIKSRRKYYAKLNIFQFSAKYNCDLIELKILFSLHLQRNVILFQKEQLSEKM